jgi:hypothetical protein
MGDRKYRTHRIERWDSDKKQFAKRLACVEDYLLAMATYAAACRRWPEARIRLRLGRRIIEDTLQSRRRPPLLDTSYMTQQAC